MTRIHIRTAATATIACAALIACSGTKPPTSDGFILAYVGPGSGDVSVCGFGSDQSFVQIGEPTVPVPQTEVNGAFQPMWGPITINCSVDSAGNGFNLKLSASVGGLMGGSIDIAGNVSTSGGSGLEASFTSVNIGTFRDNNCSLSFTYNSQPVSAAGGPIAGGRIWGHIDCPNAQHSGTQEVTGDGGSVTQTCDGHADFLFENCG